MTFASALSAMGWVGRPGYPLTALGSRINDNMVELWNLADDYEDVTTGYTLTNVTIGDGTLEVVRYRVVSLCQVVGKITFGSTTSISGAVRIDDLTADAKGYTLQTARTCYYDNSGADYHMGIGVNTGGWNDQLQLLNDSGAAVTSTVPFTWATSDVIMWSAIYQQNVESQVIR